MDLLHCGGDLIMEKLAIVLATWLRASEGVRMGAYPHVSEHLWARTVSRATDGLTMRRSPNP